jgi:hypothetical protein
MLHQTRRSDPMILLGLAMILFFGYFTFVYPRKHHGLGSIATGDQLSPDICRPRGSQLTGGSVWVDCPVCGSPRDGIWPQYHMEYVDGAVVGTIIARSITCGPCIPRLDDPNCYPGL